MSDQVTIEEIGPSLHANFDDFWHDVDAFIADVSKLAGLTDKQLNSLPILQDRITTIGGLALQVSAKNSFLKYVMAENESAPLEHWTSPFAPAIYRCSKAAQRINRMYNKTSKILVNRQARGHYRGPFFFDFIPFAILDNAIKYNIHERDISVVTSDQDGLCIADFTSWGPSIGEDEFTRIFERGYRGRSAQSGPFDGSGLGLYHARKAARDYFNGDITASAVNAPNFDYNGVSYGKHVFRIKLPAANVT